MLISGSGRAHSLERRPASSIRRRLASGLLRDAQGGPATEGRHAVRKFAGLVVFPAPDLAAAKKVYTALLGSDPYVDRPY
jgi:hypothetical protein